MWYYIKEKIELRKLFKKLKDTENSYDNDLKKLIKEGKKEGSHEFEVLLGAKISFYRDIEVEIELIITKQLRKESKKYGVPFPERNDNKMWDEDWGRKFLSEKAKFKIRKEIRQEKKEKRDVYITFILLISGLIGIITGLISVIKD